MLRVLEERIPENNHRYATFFFALLLMKERNVRTIVETGTARGGCRDCIGDGCSTLIFGDWALQNGSRLYSVDIDKKALENAKHALGKAGEFVNFTHHDSVEFLKSFNQSIDFLYLDSYDFDPKNPKPSQEHHLQEIQAAYPWLTKQSIVMIDDCALVHGGKGKLVIEYLLEKGWKIAAEGYQVLLVQE